MGSAIQAQSHTTRAATRGRATPLRLAVLAANTADTVTAAGGLVYDSVRAGWHVDVFLEKAGAERALQILGVRAQLIPSAFEFEPQWPDAVYLEASLYERHRHVRRMVTESVQRQRADVAVWRRDPPTDIDEGRDIEHRLSTAARAFKFHAMNASGLKPEVALVEPFRTR